MSLNGEWSSNQICPSMQLLRTRDLSIKTLFHTVHSTDSLYGTDPPAKNTMTEISSLMNLLHTHCRLPTPTVDTEVKNPMFCPRSLQHSPLRLKRGCSVFVRQACRSVVIGVIATASPSVGFLVCHGILVSTTHETLNALSCITRRSTWRRCITKPRGYSPPSRFTTLPEMVLGENQEGPGRRT